MWGRGYGAEIASAAVDTAFDHLAAQNVRASILSTNRRSRTVAEKVGMSLECEVSRGEHVEVVYVIDLDTWLRVERPSGVDGRRT